MTVTVIALLKVFIVGVKAKDDQLINIHLVEGLPAEARFLLIPNLASSRSNIMISKKIII